MIQDPCWAGSTQRLKVRTWGALMRNAGCLPIPGRRFRSYDQQFMCLPRRPSCDDRRIICCHVPVPNAQVERGVLPVLWQFEDQRFLIQRSIDPWTTVLIPQRISGERTFGIDDSSIGNMQKYAQKMGSCLQIPPLQKGLRSLNLYSRISRPQSTALCRGMGRWLITYLQP